jgi:hypothetical protein
MDISKLDYLKRHYGFAQWSGSNKLQENLLVWKFFPGENELPGWLPKRIGHVKLSDDEESDGVHAIQSIWKQADGETDTLLRLDTIECGSLTEAHDYLLQLLGEFQSPTLKRTETIAGDVAFTFPTETIVLFARANLVFLLRNAGRKLQPLAKFASQLDQTLTSKPKNGERKGVSVKELNFSDKGLVINESIPLDVDAFEFEPKQVWYKFFSSTGEMRLERGRPVYISRTTEPNKVMILIIAGIEPRPQ